MAKTYKDIKVESFLVSVTFDANDNVNLMVVGKKNESQAADILNAFQGEDAARLYAELMKKEK